jgi:hypothetical protein
MGYSGTFNGFTFGDGQGAAVSSITGWWGNAAAVDVLEGGMWALASVARTSGRPRLGLTLSAQTVQAFETLRDRALDAFVPTRDPMELAIGGWSKWVHVTDAGASMDPSWPGPEANCPFVVNFVAPDDARYTSAQALPINVNSPTTSANGQAPNAGTFVEHARRAFEFRFTAAAGGCTNPRVRVDHADGSWEQITLQGLSMTAGQVLTYVDGTWRLGSAPVSGRVRSASNVGAGRAPRLWRLLPSTGSDGANVVTMSVATGTFTGFTKTRGTR